MKTPRRLLLVTLVILVGAAAWIAWRYSADMRIARALASTGSAVVATRCGPIEYASAGSGPVVLIVHGTGGGHDQGMLLADPLVASGYRVVAMSRFGYLRTFAIRHPERCNALVLLVPLAYRGAAPNAAGAEPPFALRLALRALQSDFAFWALLELAPSFVMRTLLATPPHLEQHASAAERTRIDAVRRGILPVSVRATGLRIDAANAASLSRYELEAIRAPTLIVGLEDDLFDTWSGAQYTAHQVPGARFMGFESGGHLWIGHHEEIFAEVVQFLEAAS